MALCVSVITASSSLRALASTASDSFSGARLAVNCAVKGRSAGGLQLVRCVKSSDERSYAEEEVVELNRVWSKEGSGDGYGAVNGGLAEDVEVDVIGHREHNEDGQGERDGGGGGEENDYWSRNGAGKSSETTIIYPQANQKVEEDLLKRIRYQNGREVIVNQLHL
jgi:hypothetical protein